MHLEAGSPSCSGRMIIGVDVGRTFIDIVAVDETGGVVIHEVPYTASDQGQAVLDGLEQMNVSPISVERIVHGTTNRGILIPEINCSSSSTNTPQPVLVRSMPTMETA